MIEDFACPICRHRDWHPIERFTYVKTAGPAPAQSPLAPVRRRLAAVARVLVLARPRREVTAPAPAGAYQSRRRDVLFEVWFPGCDRVMLTSLTCGTCGFVTYSPRPSDGDIAAKYAYLKEVEPDIGGESGHDARSLEMDTDRSRRIYRRCAPYLGSGASDAGVAPLEVLDYGGGNGKLMRPFVEAGHRCYLADYNDHPVTGVTKLCDDIGGLDDARRFDLIVCSHVLEHVADVAGLVTALRTRLAPDGIVYAEVPHIDFCSDLGEDVDIH